MSGLTQEETARLDDIHRMLRSGEAPAFILVDLAEEARDLWTKRDRALMWKAEAGWITYARRCRSMPHSEMVRFVQHETRAHRKFIHTIAHNRPGWCWDPQLEIAKYLSQAIQSGSVADFGCGDAGMAKHLKRLNPELTVRSLDLVALDDSNEVEVCDVANTPLEDGSQRAVVMSCSMWGDRQLVLAEAKRVMANHGYLVIAEPESHWESGQLASLIQSAGFAVTSEEIDKDQRFVRIIATKVARF